MTESAVTGDLETSAMPSTARLVRGRVLGLENARALDLVFLLVALTLSFVSGYPTFQTPRYFLVVAVGLVLGGAVAWLGLRQHWSMWLRVVIAGGAYWVLGLLVAVPEVFWAPSSLPARMLGVLVAPVAGPRRILSLDIPLGSYHDVLAFVFFVAVAVSFVVFTLAWGRGQGWRLAPFVALIPMALSIALGADSRRAVWVLPQPFSVLGSQGAIGVGVILTSFAWLAWRPWAARQDRLKRAGDHTARSGDLTPALQASGTQGRWAAFRAMRLILGIAMIAAGLVVAALVTPKFDQNHARITLREGTPVEVRQIVEANPLSTYREFFSDQMFNTELFRVDAPAEVTRVRLATLGGYDGANLTAANGSALGAGDGSGALGTQMFTRVPAPIKPAGDSDGTQASPASAQIEIAQYRGEWVPLTGELGQIVFEGPNRAAFQDGFFYNRHTGTGILAAAGGLEEGTTYSVEGWQTLAPTSAVRDFAPAGGGTSLTTVLPQSVTDWIGDQDQPRTGAGLLELIDRLRARGYLSHSLEAPTSAPWAWMGPLGDYQFEASRAGHSLARIDRLFQRLNEQAQAAGPDAKNAELVGAVGDDEQFAVAAALIADSLGFNTRVVLGTRLVSDDDAQLPTCQSGKCTGGDVAVWIEVQDGDDGAWAPIDVTPQHQDQLSPRVKETSEPKHATQVRPQSAVVIPPPAAKPSGGESEQGSSDHVSKQAQEFPVAARIALVSGLGALALIAIPITILVAKAVSRRRRRLAPDGILSIRGAWDEYYDTGRAYGYQTEPASTRVEKAQQWAEGNDAPVELAHLADWASFQRPDGRDYDPAGAWAIQKRARKDLTVGTSVWERMKARFSLKYFFNRRGTSSAHRRRGPQ